MSKIENLNSINMIKWDADKEKFYTSARHYCT